MKKTLLKSSGLFFIIVILGVFGVTKAQAATLSVASDTITTSRPSASAPLHTDQAANATQVTIVDNGSIYLSSDSATFRNDTSETLNAGINVSSMSAQASGTPNTRFVYFTNTVANTHHKGDAVTVPVTAMHTISFKTASAIPASGKIVITFPGSANNTASPSASTFAFNNLASADISYKLDGTRTCTFTISSPSITCTMDNGGALAANTTVTFLIGCADASSNETTCTTQSPKLINPTISANCSEGATCSADTWSVTLSTQDASTNVLDNTKVKIGTINSVMVQAVVDPTLTFTIAGIANNTAINTGNTTGCTNAETTNTGLGSNATVVDMGVISSAAINIAAQKLIVTTNGTGGYSLTATSSGHLINPDSGYAIADSTTPTTITVGTTWFGIHPCGLDVSSGTWATGGTGGGAGAKYAWPTTTSAVTLASDSTGPIDGGSGNGITSVEYAATVNSSVPAGNYRSVITYVATPTF